MAGTAAAPPGPPSALDEAGRERLLSLLREHYARGHLGLDEMSRRVGVVLAAAYADQAVAAVATFRCWAPAAGRPRPGQPAWAAAAARAAGRAGRRWVPTPERFRDPSTERSCGSGSTRPT